MFYSDIFPYESTPLRHMFAIPVTWLKFCELSCRFPLSVEYTRHCMGEFSMSDMWVPRFVNVGMHTLP